METVEITLQLPKAYLIVEPQQLPKPIVRDLKDVMVLEAAVGGEVACVVTGDDDLLTLKSYANIRILTPGDLFALLSATDDAGPT